MGAWINRLAARQPGLDCTVLLARVGAVVSLVFIVCSCLYLQPTMSGPPWHRFLASAIVMLLVVCSAAMVRTDFWFLRLAMVLGLVTLSELMAGVSYRQDSDSLLMAHSLLLAASSTLTLSLRGTWKSALFLGLLALLVFGHAAVTSTIHQLGPTTLMVVTGAWLIMLAIRHSGPKALAAYWSDQAVRVESHAAQAVAGERISTAAANARLLHDTTLRALAVLARGGAGAAPDLVRDMATAGTFDAVRSGMWATSPAAPVARAGIDSGFLPTEHRQAEHQHAVGPSTQGAVVAVDDSSPDDVAVLLAERARRHSRAGFAIEVYGEACPLPQRVQEAMVDAAEECMVNAARHAGTDRLDVLVSHSGFLVSVLISDSGHGFDPASIPEGRFGVRHSVIGRMADVGGRAKVLSAPSRGTTIVLEVDTR